MRKIFFSMISIFSILVFNIGHSYAEFKILPSDGVAGDYLEAVSISGDYAIVGATGDDDKGDRSGSAYIFKKDSNSWAQTAKLTASDGAPWDSFGSDVSISGNYAIVGARGDDEAGAAYIFEKINILWDVYVFMRFHRINQNVFLLQYSCLFGRHD